MFHAVSQSATECAQQLWRYEHYRKIANAKDIDWNGYLEQWQIWINNDSACMSVVGDWLMVVD